MTLRENSEEIDIQRYWLVLKRQWLPATGVFSLVVALASLLALLQKPIYQAEGELLFKTNRASSMTGLSGDIGQLESLGIQNNPLDTQAEIVRSTPVLQQVIEILDLKDEEGNLLSPSDLESQLKVKGVAGTDVLQISYRSHDPRRSAAVVNEIINVFIEKNIQSNRAEAAAARDFIAQQLPITETAARAADSALRQFKESNGVIVLQEEATQSVQAIAKLGDEVAQAQAQLSDVTAQAEQLRTRIGIDPQRVVAFTALTQAPGVKETLTQLQEAQGQLAVEQTRYRDGYPTIANLERKITALQALLRDRVEQVVGSGQAVPIGGLQVGELQQSLIADLVRFESQRSGLIRRIATLSDTQAAYRQRASNLPSLEQTQRELERKLQASQTTYETLLTKLQEIQVAENQNIGNARVVSSASLPEKSVSADKRLIIAGGGVVGLLLALAVAFTLDLSDRSVKTVREARELFGFTLLGIIPIFGKSGKPTSLEERLIPRVVVKDSPFSATAGVYQMLQANLKFLSSDNPLQSIIVTSSVPQEGKSEVAANLAAVIAQVGRRVLLVDSDLRHPIQHHIWQLTNASGLSNVIVNQTSLDVSIQNVLPNLDVLSSGVVPPNPVALLDSKRMAFLMDTFSQTYDLVIFDAPPLSGIADAAILGKMADGILLVVRPGTVDSTSAQLAKEFLLQTNQNILGMVINRVNVNNEPDSYFYHAGEHEPNLTSSATEPQVPIEQNSLVSFYRSDRF
ncbi:MAG: polysaccharide biosynthesis tyrosine autokinase [Drouetiella hepatica Uher 2000/2452]|jgi:capsular exopolysaccharide synthesis family protein|uniref:Polysaccharide biosynthesis tyrosine autokinase n=1 Tax=Drouetiella hepatica Uher 2000/2452 TaxID=904376 RepID=A0A951ULG9_9CYAN|nr:polysaccharide biosynthesis tyrosine autokinase [Drouetiella hepatica Uher 2000/2452]